MEYTRLGNSGLKVSKIIAGCMSFGSSKWSPWVLDEEESVDMLKKLYDAGINTWDTADAYSNGVSETVIRKAIEKHSIPRSKLVILSKAYFGVREADAASGQLNFPDTEWANRWGLSRKHLFDAVADSVARLGTYIDVLQIHRLDDTPMEEIMHSLNDLVNSGQVRYIGASSMATWQFQMLQNIADKHGWHKFISMQNYHNLINREEEREMNPYCDATGVGRIPWSPLAGGLLCRAYKSKETSTRAETDVYKIKGRDEYEEENNKMIINRLEEVAKKREVSMAIVAIAWTLAKGDYPILGMSKQERIDEAVKAVSFKLTEDECKYLEEPYLPRKIYGYAG